MTTIKSLFVTVTNVLHKIKENGGGNRFKTPRKRKYAPMINPSDYIIDGFSDKETETKFEDDSDADFDVKQEALAAPIFDKKPDGTTAGRI